MATGACDRCGCATNECECDKPSNMKRFAVALSDLHRGSEGPVEEAEAELAAKIATSEIES